MRPHRPIGIIIHHTAVKQNPRIPVERKMQGLQAFSQRPGQVTKTLRKPAWPDVPYHFYVAVSGRIAEGRDARFAGDTNTNYDPAGYLQVVVEGEFGKDTPSAEQLASLRKLLATLMVGWNLPIKALTTHKDHASTDCPGRNFMTAWPQLRANVIEQRGAVVAARCASGPSADFAQLYCGR
jgi:N-acetylmuramoyl-L-alanine amidase